MCDCIAASDAGLARMVLQRWRQRECPVDHRAFPAMATLTGCVVVVWTAMISQELMYFPTECHNDTPILQFQWFNKDGDGPLDTLEPLRHAHPLRSAEWEAAMKPRIAKHVAALRGLDGFGGIVTGSAASCVMNGQPAPVEKSARPLVARPPCGQKERVGSARPLKTHLPRTQAGVVGSARPRDQGGERKATPSSEKDGRYAQTINISEERSEEDGVHPANINIARPKSL